MPLPDLLDWPVLVVVVNNVRDWQRVRDDGWYRIPLRHAPQPCAAMSLAFYGTRALGDAAWQVAWHAPIQRYRIVPRCELLPDEAEHPRAGEQYYKIELGALQRLVRPVPSRRLRRISFIPTTWQQLQTARDVSDLWQPDDGAAALWATFPDAVRKATQRLALEELRAGYGAR